MANNITINVRAVVDQAVSEVDKMKSKLNNLSTSEGFQNAVMGVGMGAGMMAFDALKGSIGGVTQVLGDAVKAAMEDQASQAKLTSALNANVKGWDGNSKAIEGVLKARMMLGFSDEAQRDSLAVLVARTGDVTSALDIERAAMDLARLKGIDLAAASKAIAMGMSGSGKALKELGINVKDFASGTEILAAIQAKASGQAEAYANTTAGAMEAMQLQIEEATKAIGFQLLPVVKELAFFIRDNAVPAVEYLGGVVERLTFAASLLSNPVGTAQNEIVKMQTATALAALAAAEAAAKIDEMTMAQRRAASGGAEATEAATALGAQFWTVGTAAADATFKQKGYADATRLINEWSYKARVELPLLAVEFEKTAAAARANRLDAAYGIAELPLQVAIAAEAVKAAAKVIKENPLDPKAKLDLLEAQKNLDEWKAKLRAEGPNATIIGKELGDQLGSGLYQKVMAWNALTRAQLLNLGQASGPATPGGNRNIDIPGKVLGGPVSAGQAYIVGETRPEVFVPGMSGTILPGVGGGIGTVNITVNEASTPRQTADSVLLELRRQLTRQGMTLS
jgi:hypothetical protein